MLLCVILMLFVTGTVNCGNTVEVNERFNRLETLVETLLEENEHLKTRIKELETSLDEIKEGIVVREGDETTNDEIDDAEHMMILSRKTHPQTHLVRSPLLLKALRKRKPTNIYGSKYKGVRYIIYSEKLTLQH